MGSVHTKMKDEGRKMKIDGERGKLLNPDICSSPEWQRSILVSGIYFTLITTSLHISIDSQIIPNPLRKSFLYSFHKTKDCHRGLNIWVSCLSYWFWKNPALFKSDRSSTLVKQLAYRFCDFKKGTHFTNEKPVL